MASLHIMRDRSQIAGGVDHQPILSPTPLGRLDCPAQVDCLNSNHCVRGLYVLDAFRSTPLCHAYPWTGKSNFRRICCLRNCTWKWLYLQTAWIARMVRNFVTIKSSTSIQNRTGKGKSVVLKGRVCSSQMLWRGEIDCISTREKIMTRKEMMIGIAIREFP